MQKKNKAVGGHRGGSPRTALTLLVILLLAAGAVLSLTVFFKIEEVRVEGTDRYYTEEQILKAGDIQAGQNMFLFSARAAEEKIWTLLPYISSVSVKRQLPSTIIIDVRVSDYTLSLPYEGGSLTLSETLKILGNAVENESFTLIWGFQPVSGEVGTSLATDSEDGTYYLEALVKALSENDILNMVSDINVADKLNLSVVYDNRIYVMLGTASNIDYKARMLEEVARSQLESDATGYLDLSTAGKGTFKSGELELPEGYRTKAAAWA
ncbi:MAG: FtsQ-type POTRA domain-containing protein [Oscillospiraceae bacterium]|nr:FtsQ-type POTRA domain-containing protein [Oscillospiraceae bacterium]